MTTPARTNRLFHRSFCVKIFVPLSLAVGLWGAGTGAAFAQFPDAAYPQGLFVGRGATVQGDWDRGQAALTAARGYNDYLQQRAVTEQRLATRQMLQDAFRSKQPRQGEGEAEAKRPQPEAINWPPLLTSQKFVAERMVIESLIRTEPDVESAWIDWAFDMDQATRAMLTKLDKRRGTRRSVNYDTAAQFVIGLARGKVFDN